MKISNIAALTSALLVSAVALASEVDFQSLDKDANGMLSASEAGENPTLAAQFKILDVDQDGQLSESEFANFGK
ncbi:crotonobetainyl-CoA--carnitine CoA-transferase (plasmid) [Pseudoalteromonas xiamenensis]|uniref:crotonobetainyl-CoA--carnitine CoA-transferase n=1 Tax=Pseudoalteromonas xiamenensis TaxID=882626 RepID=UPI0027E5980C|nr:crotonobetainyl-CoA--carnitine CoA-transferase [Pseudoalteromonas xiamenensis]WMN61719.1 crotonobetainyl-CoA--carnitine CoA-transferase [Pseudoalteromonas xiamenensis]